jgi:hypothetical protein
LGGETYKGIARKYHSDWLGWVIIDEFKKSGPFPRTPLADEEKEIDAQLQYEVRQFYITEFWLKCKCNNLYNQQMAESIFDFAVNAGVEIAISLAQKVVKVDQDGCAGIITTAALNNFNPDHFMAAYAIEKIKRYVQVVAKRPQSKKFFAGWVIRSVSYLVILAFLVGCKPHKMQKPTETVRTDSIFLKEYVVKKMNEHEVRLISATDTVTIYMENAYSFYERIVFIKYGKVGTH